MSVGLRGTTPPAEDGVGEFSSIAVANVSPFQSEIVGLRGRWELASVLNFLNVFEPVIGSNLKLTAEEIEAGLINPSRSLSRLHIKLLKGIPPVSKALDDSDAWVTVLCKKLAIWWPWVAEGEVPLTTANGEEMSRYKKLDPINRLLILKALCEIRADQGDVVSFINDALKNGAKISSFRKEKIGYGNEISYWCDGNTVMGYRLYKEVNKNDLNTKMKVKASKGFPAIHFQWETLATNLEEFRNAVDEISSKKVLAETSIRKSIETDILPILEKLHKKKERALKQKQREEKLLNDASSCGTGITRSCRNRKLISYTFDEYDRAIDEAIEVTKKRKTTGDHKKESDHFKQESIEYSGDLDGMESRTSDCKNGDSDPSKDGTIKEDIYIKNGTESGRRHEAGNDDDDDSDDDYDVNHDDDNDKYNSDQMSYHDEEMESAGNKSHAQKPFGSRWSKRLAGITTNRGLETGNLGTKSRLRQRPSRNSALDHIVVPDSEDEDLSERTVSEEEDISPVADSEEVSDC